MNYEASLPKLIYEDQFIAIPKSLRKRAFDSIMHQYSIIKVQTMATASQQLQANLRKELAALIRMSKLDENTNFIEIEPLLTKYSKIDSALVIKEFDDAKAHLIIESKYAIRKEKKQRIIYGSDKGKLRTNSSMQRQLSGM